MEATIRAIEMTGAIDAGRQLHLDHPLPIAGPSRVRVIILVPDSAEEIDEATWLHFASANPAFSFLKDAREDIYTPQDGKPFHDQG